MKTFHDFSSLSVASVSNAHLLYAAGIAAVAAGLYYYMKTDKPDPVQKASDCSAVLVVLKSDVKGFSVPQDSAKKKQEDKVLSATLDSVKSQMQDRVRELEKLLRETKTECERKTKEYEREREAHRMLKLEYEEMMKVLSHNAESLKSVKQNCLELRILQSHHSGSGVSYLERYKKMRQAHSEVQSTQDEIKEMEVLRTQAEEQYLKSVMLNNEIIVQIKDIIMEASQQRQTE